MEERKVKGIWTMMSPKFLIFEENLVFMIVLQDQFNSTINMFIASIISYTIFSDTCHFMSSDRNWRTFAISGDEVIPGQFVPDPCDGGEPCRDE